MIKIFAKAVSILFHPLLILTYILLVLMLVDPYAFGVYHLNNPPSKVLLLRVFLSTFFIPAVAVAMLHFLGLVRSFELKDKQDRIGPYIITGIFYLWLFRNFLDNALIPPIYATFLLGATIGLFLAFLINIFSKISVHAVGMGGLIGMILLIMLLVPYEQFTIGLASYGRLHLNLMALLLLTILIAGLVGTCRLLLQAHQPNDLYGGYLVGFIAQFVALQVMVALDKIQIPVS